MAAAPEEVADAMYEMIEEYQGRKKFKAGDLIKAMIRKFGDDQCDKKLCKAAIRTLMDSGRCVYTYFGGSFIEMPPNEGDDEDVAEQSTVVAKKVKKKRLGGGAGAGSSRSREKSHRRPQHVEKLPPCRHACPSGNRIREFLTAIAQAERLEKPTQQAFEQAWQIYTDTSPFPAVCGRVCPHPCEDDCNRKELGGPVNVNQVERAIGDFGLEKKLRLKTLSEEKRPEKIAVVGAGPAGLSCAYQLARRGYGVTVFEATEKPGGMLLWQTPRSQLPADVLAGEIQKILDLGIELKCNTRVGKDVSLEDLRAQYQAVTAANGPGADFTDLQSQAEGGDADKDAADLALVTAAIGQGRRAALAIDLKLRGEEEPERSEPPLISADRMRLDHYDKKERAPSASPEQVVEEAGRCMSCGYCFDCEKCWLFCQDQAIDKPLEKGALYAFNMQNCTSCGKCAKECPCGFIDML